MSVIGCNQNKMPTLKPYLDIKVKSGWHYIEEDNIFLSTNGQKFSPAEELPSGTKIFYMTPSLSQADPETLSPDERNLAHYLQIIFPQGEKAQNHMETVQQWPFIENVRPPQNITLP